MKYKQKCCISCGEVQPLRQFPHNFRYSDDHNPMCRTCVKAGIQVKHDLRRVLGMVDSRETDAAARRQHTHGVDKETYRLMLEKQEGKCAICGCVERLVVDHDHSLEHLGPLAVRGLLCSHCNHGLGFFRDDPGLLQDAIRYLQDAQLQPLRKRRLF